MLRRTLVLALLTIPATAAHATAPMNPGGWGQLAGSTPAMVGAAGAALTPDGSQLLVAGGTDAFTFYGHGEGFGGLSVFARDGATGALRQVQCVSSDGSDSAGNEACDPATALNGANAVAVSPDGVAVAVASTGAGSITLFARDAATGKLGEVACLQQSVPLNGRCRQGPTLDGVSALTFSPDGHDVLAVTPPHNALVDLHRDDDGVTHIQCLSATGTSGGCTRMPRLNGVDALALSGDGRQVYLRTGAGLVWLARDLATGALAPGGCVNPVREGGACQAAPPADPYAYGFVYGSYASGGHSIVLSPDGSSLYTGLNDGLSAFRRDEDGTLHFAGCYVAAPIASDDTSGDETVDDTSGDDSAEDPVDDSSDEARAAQAGGACTPIDAFEAPRALAIAPDGSTLFTTNYSAVSILHRDPAGVLTDAGCLAEQDDRCGAAPVLGAPADLVAAGGQVYGVGGNVVATLAPAPALSAAGDGAASVSCSVACSGTARAVSYGSGLRAGVVARGAARAFSLRAGGRVRLRLRAPHRRGRIVLVARPRTRLLATGTLGFGRRGRPARARYCLHSGCSFLGGTVTAPQARAGRFAAFAVRSRLRRGVTHTAIAVVDLTHRRVAFLSSAQGSGHGVAVPRIVVKRDGAIAWIACRGHGTRCARQHADEVHVHDALGTRLLSAAPGRVSTYLSLTGTTLSYEIAGIRRRVPLR